MPKEYESMRDDFMKRGLNVKAAKRKAARIYNSKHPDTPVHRGSDKKGDK